MKTLVLILVIIFYFAGSYGQNTDIHDHVKIVISSIGEFSIPNEMELRDDGSFISLLSNAYLKQIKFSGTKPSIVIQPKGMNEMSSESFKKYARILVNIQKGKPGDFYKYNEKFNFTVSDTKEINNIFRTEVENSITKIGGKISHWYPFEIIQINGLTCIRISYEYDSQRGTVLVKAYKFYNYNMAIEFTLSCRKSDEIYWKEKYSKVINSFNFENKN